MDKDLEAPKPEECGQAPGALQWAGMPQMGVDWLWITAEELLLPLPWPWIGVCCTSSSSSDSSFGSVTLTCSSPHQDTRPWLVTSDPREVPSVTTAMVSLLCSVPLQLGALVGDKALWPRLFPHTGWHSSVAAIPAGRVTVTLCLLW